MRALGACDFLLAATPLSEYETQCDNFSYTNRYWHPWQPQQCFNRWEGYGLLCQAHYPQRSSLSLQDY